MLPTEAVPEICEMSDWNVGLPEKFTLGATQGGLLIPPGDLDALAAQWESLLLDPDHRLRLATTGQHRVREFFSAAVLAEQSLDLLERFRNRDAPEASSSTNP